MTRVTVSYALRLPHQTDSGLARLCPAATRCRWWHGQAALPAHGSWWVVVSRTLSCSPPLGEYHRPAVACRALADNLRRLAAKRSLCLCASQVGPPAIARGVIDGRRRQVGIDGCTACNLGTPAMADIGILTPGG